MVCYRYLCSTTSEKSATTPVQSSTKAKKSSNDHHVTNFIHDDHNSKSPNESSTIANKAMVKHSFSNLRKARTASSDESTPRVNKLRHVDSLVLKNQEPKKSDAASTSSSSVF